MLNAFCSTCSGSFDYFPPLGTLLRVGSHELTASFSPDNETNFNKSTQSGLFPFKLILVVSNNFFQILVVIEVKKPVCEIQWLRDPDLQAGDSAGDKIFNAVCWHKKCNTTVSGSFVYSVDSDYKYRLNDYFILNSFKYVSYPFSVGLSPAAKLYLQTFFLKTYIITLRYP